MFRQIGSELSDTADALAVATYLSTDARYAPEFVPLYHDLVAGNLLSIDLGDGNGLKKSRAQAKAMREDPRFAAFLTEDKLTYVDGERKMYRLWAYTGNAVGVLMVGLSDPANKWTPELAAMATVLISRFTDEGVFKTTFAMVSPGTKALTKRSGGSAEPQKSNGFGASLLSRLKAGASSRFDPNCSPGAVPPGTRAKAWA